MYRASSPIFDMPEFPTLRRVKPLPKRRRTSGSATMAMAGAATTTATTATATAESMARPGGGVMSPSDHLAVLAGNPMLLASSLEDLRLPGPDATPEELLAHAETLSARMALQSYYMPMLAGAANSNVGTGAGSGADFLDSGSGDGVGGGTGNANASGNAVGRFGADAFGSGLLADLAASGMGATIGFSSAYGTGRGGGDEDDDDEQGDGDYIDHLQQPGNTKKRKVPAHPSSLTGRGHELDSPTGIGGGDFVLTQDELGGDRAILTGRASAEREHGIAEFYQPFSSLPSAPSLGLSSSSGAGIFSTVTSVAQLAQRKSKLTAATLAGLQHKEMLKSRKRQLAAVLGALSHGDTLALDQALSASYPFVAPGFDDARSGASGGAGSDPPKVRLSRRMVVRLSRGARRHPRHPDQAPFPMRDFTFVCPSATADRLIATKEEVAMLRNRFEAELARQAAKAAKMAAANKIIASAPAKSGKSKRTDRAQQRARMITEGKSTGGGSNNEQADTASQPSPTGDASVTGVKPKAGGKKKKRSALANASNPHHLRNYVPSRLPHAGGQNAASNTTGANGRDTLWPLPLRFLSAEIPPRRRKKPTDAPQPIVSSQLTNPAEEWICAFCEYGLFYGDEADYRRAIRNRKKILRRRRRARERAAAAASGNGTAVKPHEKNAPANEEYDGAPAFETSTDDVVGHQQHGRQGKWKGGPDKERGESYG